MNEINKVEDVTSSRGSSTVSDAVFLFSSGLRLVLGI